MGTEIDFPERVKLQCGLVFERKFDQANCYLYARYDCYAGSRNYTLDVEGLDCDYGDECAYVASWPLADLKTMVELCEKMRALKGLK